MTHLSYKVNAMAADNTAMQVWPRDIEILEGDIY